MGRDAARRLHLPADRQSSGTALSETVELLTLDELQDGGLSFRGVLDLRPVVMRCSKGGVASGEDLLAVAETLATARRLRRQIVDPELRPACTTLVETVVTLPELEQRLKFVLEEGGRVADRASDSLARLRRQWNEGRQERRDKLQELMRQLAPVLQDTVIAQRHGRPVLAVKAGAVGRVPGQVHDSSASGSTLFVEPRSVLTIGNRLVDLEGRIRDEEQRVLSELSQEVAQYQEPLNVVSAVLQRLDLALARGRYGRWLGAAVPILDEQPEAPFRLDNLRHPLLVWQEKRSAGPSVVPISIEVRPQHAGGGHHWPEHRWQDRDVEKHWPGSPDGPCRNAAAVFRSADPALVCTGAGGHW